MAHDLFLGPAALREYARRHTLSAMRTVVYLCEHGKKESTRLAAAKELLDRGWGRSIQAVTYENAEGSELLDILKNSYTSATTQLTAPIMIERTVEGESMDSMLNKPSRVRPRLRKDIEEEPE